MKMNPIYIGNMNPSAQQYSRMEPEDSLELEELQEVTAGASSCRPRMLLGLTLLCCLLLSSNVVLLNLYIKQSRITEEALYNQTKLLNYENSLSFNNTILGNEKKELSQHNIELQNKSLGLVESESTLLSQNENLTQYLNTCWTENGVLSASNANLTISNGVLNSEVEVLTNLKHHLQGLIANLSHSEDELLETNADLASTDAKLLQWVKDLEAMGSNLTLEMAKKSAEQHDLSLQYATLEKHCHSILSSPRDHHHRHHPELTSNHDLTGKSIYFSPNNNGHVTFQSERVDALSSFTICLKHSKKLYWEVSLHSDTQEKMAVFQCLLQYCTMSINSINLAMPWPNLAEEANDWRHTCLSWRADSTTVHLWLNGIKTQGHANPQWGVELLARSVKLQYNSGSGIVTDLHVWDHALSGCEIGALSLGLGVTSGNVLNWANLRSWQPSESWIQPVSQEGMCRSSY